LQAAAESALQLKDGSRINKGLYNDIKLQRMARGILVPLLNNEGQHKAKSWKRLKYQNIFASTSTQWVAVP